jgi:FdhD protein
LKEEMKEKIEIIRFEHQVFQQKEDFIISERLFTINWNSKEIATLLCSPNHLDYLAVGFLKTEGYLGGKEDIKSVSIDSKKGLAHVKTDKNSSPTSKLYDERTITSYFLPAKPVQSALLVTPDQILILMSNFLKHSSLFKETGGVHSCALASCQEILFQSEDIGRHNALDKVIGHAILGEVPCSEKLFLTTGRFSSEIVIKAARAGLPILISHSAPTSLSAELAEQLGITLIGFARDFRFNIYTHPERVHFKS